MSYLRDLARLYQLLEGLCDRVGGYCYLRDCDGHPGWPERGVYFFFDHGETRKGGNGLRVTRVGTHAVYSGSRGTLWQRLLQHKGTTAGAYPGGGNHRGSIFRLHVGTALLNSRSYGADIRHSWGRGGSASYKVRMIELPLERDVSAFIRNLPFLWLSVPDHPGPDSDRKVIEANAVALLSNRGRNPIDPPSSKWLGSHASEGAVRESGLWNVNHVNGSYEASFLDVLSRYVAQREA